jgi:acetate kinase
MATLSVLVLNGGSSSIKFTLFETAGAHRKILLDGEVDGVGSSDRPAKISIKDAEGKAIADRAQQIFNLAGAFAVIADAVRESGFPVPAAVGHRMVSAGPKITENQRLTTELIDQMERNTAFAPLHAPSEIALMREAMRVYPDAAGFVCFDGWFHRDLPQVTRRLAIPEKYAEMGVHRFGAHGLSYESIVYKLQPNIPARLIAAHLGNGASVCAMRDGKSVDTSMGLTPAGGIISGTRTGDIDPGALIFILRKLAEEAPKTSDAADCLEAIVNKESGLKGLSSLSNDMRELRNALDDGNESAQLAVGEFTYAVRKCIGAYTAVLGGLDMLVFTGGIGEHDEASRAEICTGLACFGIKVDEKLNRGAKGDAKISAADSSVIVRVIPAEEDLMIVNHVCRLMDE